MNFPETNLSKFHCDVLQQTQLGKLCGKNELFRDRYEILRMLGRGGFGVTFVAKDVYLPGQSLCVIKLLYPKVEDLATRGIARQRFEREARMLAKLGSHSQIPMLLDYFVIEGEFYLVQEYIHGPTLARLVRRYGVQSETQVREFLWEMLHVLDYIHRNQVIHRDIKPQNIIKCQDDGRLVLIDFGAVKEEIAQLSEIGDKTPATHFIGTLGFAPPEQFSLSTVYASDIYALGVTCIYLLTRKAPLNLQCDRATGEIYWQHQAQVSYYFGRIIDKMVKISLEDRYQAAREILRELVITSNQEDLAEYLTLQPRMEDDSLDDDEVAQYLPPATRTAIAIREWKARKDAKQQHQNLNHQILSDDF
ncbi:serine/threonine protein kinase [Crinalium epipsammum PCC 9333]|uniref:non-specific serine/threonine protein kinase n=1 Tax=Crinalium epipsammum PCC 9333 TaxID=1173022 RepID=K9VZ36_9CYAN|nr:serine/threonine-protein kinase [Crinalium epipsammum]AFZ12804.1 serine/threonine protein kinase [Crinalium epipsammum PCC 9333]